MDSFSQRECLKEFPSVTVGHYITNLIPFDPNLINLKKFQNLGSTLLQIPQELIEWKKTKNN